MNSKTPQVRSNKKRSHKYWKGYVDGARTVIRYVEDGMTAAEMVYLKQLILDALGREKAALTMRNKIIEKTKGQLTPELPDYRRD